MDYRCLVHERDEAVYREIQMMVLDIRGFYVSILSTGYTAWRREERESRLLNNVPFCFTAGWALPHLEQKPGETDQPQGGREGIYVLRGLLQWILWQLPLPSSPGWHIKKGKLQRAERCKSRFTTAFARLETNNRMKHAVTSFCRQTLWNWMKLKLEENMSHSPVTDFFFQ